MEYTSSNSKGGALISSIGDLSMPKLADGFSLNHINISMLLKLHDVRLNLDYCKS